MHDHYGPMSGHTFLAWIETSESLVALDTGWDVADGLPYEGSDVEAITRASEATGKPLSHILLTHDHPDHCMNLPLLRERWPAVTLAAHPHSSAPDVTLPLTGGEALTLGGVRVEVLATPGHSAHRDELCYFLPDYRLLFCGDVAQPQGPSYSLANGLSPVPYFYFGDDYCHSLENLIALDCAWMRTGHGDLLGSEQAKQWLRVTLATVTRIQELAWELADRYPERDEEWLMALLYDHLVDERHFGTRAAAQRKRQMTHEGISDYEYYDIPGLRWAVQQAMDL